MSKYVSIKIRSELLDLIRSCQIPGEALSDTIKGLLDPTRIFHQQSQRDSDVERRAAVPPPARRLP